MLGKSAPILFIGIGALKPNPDVVSGLLPYILAVGFVISSLGVTALAGSTGLKSGVGLPTL